MKVVVERIVWALCLSWAGCRTDDSPSSPPAPEASPSTPASDTSPDAPAPRPPLDPAGTLRTIAIGSCLDQKVPHPILTSVTAARPDVFVWLGDNVYADAETTQQLRTAYDSLGRSEVFIEFAKAVPQLAVWDDHDYGINDSGKEFLLKEQSKAIMLDFFGEPADSPRRARAGNYDEVVVGPAGRRVQFLLLDTRWFRDALIPDPREGRRYQPNGDPSATVLGEAQWTWLQQRLAEPAEVRLLVSSIQLIVGDEHSYESWALFPRERRRMFEVLGRSGADGIIVVSGDRHRGEISCAHVPGLSYPLVELTSSSLNRPLLDDESNRYRVTELLRVPNFGIVSIEWGPDIMLGLRLLGEEGQLLLEQAVPLGALTNGSKIESGLTCKKFGVQK